MIKRAILLLLGVVLAGCAYRGPPVTWVETAHDPPPPNVHAKMFIVDRQWDVGDCILYPGTHATLDAWGRVNVGIGLSTLSGGAARLRFGLTFLDADGTTLGHYPDEDGKVFLQRIPAGARDYIGGTHFTVSRDVYARVTRVLIHARC